MTSFPYSSLGSEMGFGSGALGCMKLNEMRDLCKKVCKTAPNYPWVKERENEKHCEPGYFPNEAHSDPVSVGVLYIASLSPSGGKPTSTWWIWLWKKKKQKKHI